MKMKIMALVVHLIIQKHMKRLVAVVNKRIITIIIMIMIIIAKVIRIMMMINHSDLKEDNDHYLSSLS